MKKFLIYHGDYNENVISSYTLEDLDGFIHTQDQCNRLKNELNYELEYLKNVRQTATSEELNGIDLVIKELEQNKRKLAVKSDDLPDSEPEQVLYF